MRPRQCQRRPLPSAGQSGEAAGERGTDAPGRRVRPVRSSMEGCWDGGLTDGGAAEVRGASGPSGFGIIPWSKATRASLDSLGRVVTHGEGCWSSWGSVATCWQEGDNIILCLYPRRSFHGGSSTRSLVRRLENLKSLDQVSVGWLDGHALLKRQSP